MATRNQRHVAAELVSGAGPNKMIVNQKVGDGNGQHPTDQSTIDSCIENDAEVQRLPVQ